MKYPQRADQLLGMEVYMILEGNDQIMFKYPIIILVLVAEEWLNL